MNLLLPLSILSSTLMAPSTIFSPCSMWPSGKTRSLRKLGAAMRSEASRALRWCQCRY